MLTHWGRVAHICVVKSTIIGSDNGLSPGRRQAIIWTNAGILLIGPLGTNFIEILIGIQTFSFKKMHLKMSSAKWRPVCLGLNVLRKRVHTNAKILHPHCHPPEPRLYCHGNQPTHHSESTEKSTTAVFEKDPLYRVESWYLCVRAYADSFGICESYLAVLLGRPGPRHWKFLSANEITPNDKPTKYHPQ